VRSAVAPDPAVAPIRNGLTNPSFEGVSVSPLITNAGTTATVSTATARYGVKSARVVVTSENWGYWNGVSDLKLPRNGTSCALSVWVNPDSTQTLALIDYGSHGSQGSAVSCPAGTWTRLTLIKSWSPATSTIFISVRTPSRTMISSPFYLDGMMVQVGATSVGEYSDGSTPGWRWTGTANASESVGYPYTLESIAGKSLAWRENTTGSVTPGTFDLPAIQGNGVSIYVVQNMPAAPPLRGVQYHDAASLDSLTIEHFDGANPGRSTAARSRGGTNNWRTANNSLAVTGGRSYAAATVAADGNIATIHTREGSSASASPVGDGVPRPCRLTTPNPVIYAGAFKGEHNRETILRIMAWLARKYGAPVPSGY